MADPLGLRFLVSVTSAADLPASRAEVAVVGRSNVGKSSLLNALSGRRAVAHVSKTPGRTRTLNCFAIGAAGPAGDPPATMLDCPGYGYASVSRTERATWGPMVEDYLTGREALVMTMVLVDGEVGPTPLDVQMLEWLHAAGVVHTVVATKHDKVRSSRRDRRRKDLAAACGLEPRDVVWTSAAKGVNIDRLRDMVRDWTATAR